MANGTSITSKTDNKTQNIIDAQNVPDIKNILMKIIIYIYIDRILSNLFMHELNMQSKLIKPLEK